MKVRMKTVVAGPEWSYQPGQVADLPEDRAKELIAGGYAVAVEELPSSEVTMVPEESGSAPPEAAMPTSASADEVMGAGDEEPPAEKPAARRGRGRRTTDQAN